MSELIAIDLHGFLGMKVAMAISTIKGIIKTKKYKSNCLIVTHPTRCCEVVGNDVELVRVYISRNSPYRENISSELEHHGFKVDVILKD